MKKEKYPYYIASVSFGKDSLYMLLRLIETKAPLDEVVFYDTGMEFQTIYDTRDAILPLLTQLGIAYKELAPNYDFLYKMFKKPVDGRTNGFHYGYSWCGGRCRWGTTDKLKALDAYAERNEAAVYIGIAAAESAEIKFLHKIAQSAEGVRGAVRLFANAVDNEKSDLSGLAAMAKAMRINLRGIDLNSMK